MHYIDLKEENISKVWTGINIEFDIKNADGILGKNNA
jgi:hypothetical protein